MAEVSFRAGRVDDLEAVAAIYSAGIAERIATFETEPRTVSDIAAWAIHSQPFIVAERDGRIVGFARAGAYSDRCFYQGVSEHAVSLEERVDSIADVLDRQDQQRRRAGHRNLGTGLPGAWYGVFPSVFCGTFVAGNQEKGSRNVCPNTSSERSNRA